MKWENYETKKNIISCSIINNIVVNKIYIIQFQKTRHIEKKEKKKWW